MENEDALIRVRHIKKYFPLNSSAFRKANIRYLHAVDDVSFDIKDGEIFGIVGESGSGKSTIGRCILRLLELDGGEIWFRNNNIGAIGRGELQDIRRNMQMIFQDPLASFNPKHRLDNALREIGRVYGMSQTEISEEIDRILSYINLPKEFLKRMPNQLSGGQLQRLAIARLLILHPKFIVADEPVSALDVSVRAQVLNLLLDLREEKAMTILFISHDLNVVEHVCDRVAVVYLGMIVEMASKEELFHNHRHPYTQALMSAKPKEHPLENKKRVLLEGDIPHAIDIGSGCRFASRCRYCSGICRAETPKLLEIMPGHLVACHFPENLLNTY
jgi:peptide/nickel transport system ATP-binding protein/oligopeptide transport system ATP-binding protein